MTARTPSSSACEGACSISSASRDSRDGKPPVPSIRLQSVSSVSRFAGATSEELPAIQWVAPRYSFARGAVSFGLPAALTTLLLGAEFMRRGAQAPARFFTSEVACLLATRSKKEDAPQDSETLRNECHGNAERHRSGPGSPERNPFHRLRRQEQIKRE